MYSDPDFNKHAALDRLYEDLKHCRTLEDNWDGDGAKRILPETISAAGRIINVVEGNLRRYAVGRPDLLPTVAPSIDGGIILKWQGRGHTLHAEILSKWSRPNYVIVEWMKMDAYGGANHWQNDGLPGEVVQSVSEFLEIDLEEENNDY